MVERCVIVAAPCGCGGRRITVDDETMGMAYSLHDLTVFLKFAGLVGGDELDVVESDLIEWYGGGPEVWPAPGWWAGLLGGAGRARPTGEGNEVDLTGARWAMAVRNWARTGPEKAAPSVNFKIYSATSDSLMLVCGGTSRSTSKPSSVR
jgi:hypothetical protein